MNWQITIESKQIANESNATPTNEFFVIAIDDEGRVYANKNTTPNRELAETWLNSIKQRFNPFTFDPGNSPHWKYYRRQPESDL